MERLLYAQKIWEVGPALLQHQLMREADCVPNSWLSGLKADLSWLLDLEPSGCGTIPSFSTQDLTGLIEYWQQGGLEWRRLVKRAWKRSGAQETLMHEAQFFHRSFYTILQEEGGATFHDGPSQNQRDELDYPCHCGRIFSTPQGLATHKRHQHQEFCPEHHLLSGTCCPICMRHFWSTARLQQHLSYISRKTGLNQCFQALQSRGYEVEFQTENQQVALQGLHRVEALPVEGPRLEPRDIDRQRLDSLAADIRRLKKRLSVAFGSRLSRLKPH